ncbi:lipopolysaccharide heptosyltransferase I [Mycena polygramma]|nr:lipopolysaccharide heptosyltransferase I [Mycena polygramma]
MKCKRQRTSRTCFAWLRELEAEWKQDRGNASITDHLGRWLGDACIVVSAPPPVYDACHLPRARQPRAPRHRDLRRLPAPLAARTENLFVDDDSRDGTVEEVARLREDGGYAVELLVRPRESGERGLSSAVLRGFERARGTRLVVMDADLQHPPSAIPALLDALGPDDAPYPIPMALGTRYGPGVSMDARWPMCRRLISWGARMLARPLTSASDPMTGFFALRKDAFGRAQALSPRGFKIALELLLAVPSASHPPEVPYAFGVRTAGASKLGAATIVKYVLQLLWLYRRRLGWLWHVLLGVVEGVGRLPYAVRRRIGLGGMRKGAKGSPLLPLARRNGRLE